MFETIGHYTIPTLVDQKFLKILGGEGKRGNIFQGEQYSQGRQLSPLIHRKMSFLLGITYVGGKCGGGGGGGGGGKKNVVASLCHH